MALFVVVKKLYDIFESKTTTTDCCLLQEQPCYMTTISKTTNSFASKQHEHEQIEQQQQDEEQEKYILTHESGKFVVRQHINWIHQQIQQQIHSILTTQLHHDNHQQQQQQDEQQNNNIHIDFILGYLCQNDIDFIFSVLASTKFSGGTKTTNTNNNRIIHVTIHIIPLLLNTRWTVQEILNALIPITTTTKTTTTTPTTNIATRQYYCTLLLCNNNNHQLQQVAENVVDKIRHLPSQQSQQDHHHHHVSQCLIIPPFSKAYMKNIAISTAKEINPNNSIPSSPTPPLSLPIVPTHYYHHHPTTTNTNTNMNHQRKKWNNTHQQYDHNDNDNNNNKDDVALIVFTSGTTTSSSSTTSTAKGVLLSHTSILIQSYTKTNQQYCGYDPHTILFGSTVPFYHVGGLSSILALWLCHGCLYLPTIISPTSTNQSNSATTTTTSSFQPAQVFHSLFVATRPTTTAKNTTIAITASTPATSVNTLVVVPAMIYALQEYMESQQQQVQDRRRSIITTTTTTTTTSYPYVRLILIGGSSCSQQQVDYLFQTFPFAKIVQTYACTEAASSLTFYAIERNLKTTLSTSKSSPLPPSSAFSLVLGGVGDCVGIPPPHVQLCLLPRTKNSTSDSNDKTKNQNIQTTFITQPYQVGIIATRGPHVMNGYWYRGQSLHQQQQQQGISHHGHNNNWFITNDLGYYNEKNVWYFVGRNNDTIRTGGETVVANEIEKIIMQFTSVIKECAIFPLPDRRFGQIVCCAIVLQQQQQKVQVPTSNRTISNNSNNNSNTYYTQVLKEWCSKKGLAGYKHPKKVFIVSELPRNTAGKVIKKKLMEQFQKQQQQQPDPINTIGIGRRSKL